MEFIFQPVSQTIALLNKTLPGPKPCFKNHQNVIAKQQWLIAWSNDRFPLWNKVNYWTLLP